MPNKNDTNGVDERKPEPTQLCQSYKRLPASQIVLRTAEYAKDPTHYLEQQLGKVTIEKRKDLLSIPTEIDKDIYGNGKHKTQFENHIANLFGKEAGLFFLTGIQAQLTAMKIHCQRAENNRVAWHVTSHLELYEERSFEKLYGLDRILLPSRDEENSTVEEIKEVLSLPQDQRPAAIVIEVPNRSVGCKTYTFSELEAISAACKEAGVIFHLDGARIWEIEPYYQQSAGKTFPDIARLFDSVYVSFYKGLGGAAGAMLLGEEDLINEAKVWRRRAGGTAVTLMYEVIDCERGYNENIGTFGRKWEKMLEVQNSIEAATKEFKTKNGKRIVSFMAVPAVCCQVVTLYRGYTTEELQAARDKVEAKMNVRLFDTIRSRQTVDEMAKAAKESKTGTEENHVEKSADESLLEREWIIGNESEKIETQVFVAAYVGLCEELVAVRKGTET